MSNSDQIYIRIVYVGETKIGGPYVGILQAREEARIRLNSCSNILHCQILESSTATEPLETIRRPRDEAKDILLDLVKVNSGSDAQEILKNVAMDVLNRQYVDDVRDICKSIVDRVSSSELESEDAVHEAVDEAVDSDRRVIITHLARETVLLSSNRDAYEENNGGKPDSVELQAYEALRTDVYEELGDLDDILSPDDDDTDGEDSGD